MYAVQHAMKAVPGKKPPDIAALLMAIMDWLESTKAANLQVEGIASETTAHALIEEYALKLFSYADAQDNAENYDK